MQTLMQTLLIVDDDHDIRQLLSEVLKNNHYNTLLAKDGIEMMQVLATQAVDLIILDIMMPGEDGLSLLKRLPSVVNPPPPVLILSARGEDIDRIVGLEMGSDDYLVKPFHPRELVARVKTVLRRLGDKAVSKEKADDLADAQSTDSVFFGRWLFDRVRRLIYKLEESDINIDADPSKNASYTTYEMSADKKQALKKYAQNHMGEGLNTIEYRLLKAFTDHPQRVLSRDFLLEATLGREHLPTDRTIDVQVSRLRQRLEDDARQSGYIRTVRYEGYMLSVPVLKIK